VPLTVSLLSFKVFCIERYAEHSGAATPDVYALFKRAGLLRMLDDDYEDLHGMSWEYLIALFDEYLATERETA